MSYHGTWFSQTKTQLPEKALALPDAQTDLELLLYEGR
jgi:hypothetical protein